MIGPELDTDEHGQRLVQFQPGELLTGGWCQPCALPSPVRAPVYVLSPRGVSLWQIIEACVEEGMHTHLPGKPELLRFEP